MNASEILALLLRTGLVLAIAFVADRVFRRSAAVRSALLRAALVATVAAAVLPPLLAERVRPVVVVPEPVASAPVLLDVPKPELRIPRSTSKAVASRPVSPSPSVPVAAPSPAGPFLPNDWPVRLWGVGMALTGLYWLLAHVAVVRLLRRSRRATFGTPYDVLTEVCREQGLPVPELRVAPHLPSPLVCGPLRPCILIPEEMAAREDRTELAAALAHEAAHLARRDVAWTYATRLVQTVLWFQPLVWGLHPRMTAASEELCDLQAVQGGLRRETYADCLLRLAEAASRPRLEGKLGSGMATNRTSLSSRIEALMDTRRIRSTRLSSRARAAVAVGVVGLAVLGGVFAAGPARSPNPVAQNRVRPSLTPGTRTRAIELYRQTVERYVKANTLAFTVVKTESGYRGYRMHVRFARPDRLWMEFWDRNGSGEARNVVVADGKTVTVYDELEPDEVVVSPQEGSALEAVRRASRIRIPQALAFAIVKYGRPASLEKYLEQANVGLVGGDRRTVGLEYVIPEQSSLTTIRVDGEGRIVESGFWLQQPTGQKSVSTELYSDIRIDEPLDEVAFRFVPPAGAKVVHPAKFEMHRTPEALALAKRIETAPKALKSVSFEVDRTETVRRSDGQPSTTRIHRKIEYVADGRARVEDDYPRHWGDVLTVSDGKELVATSTKSSTRYVRQKVDANPYNRMRQILISGEFRAPQPGFGELVEMAYLGWAETYNLQRFSMEVGTKTRVDGEPVDVLILRTSMQKPNGAPAEGGITERVYVDRAGFIRRYEKRIVFGRQQVNDVVVEVQNLRLNPTFPASRFQIEVPANREPISTGEAGREEVEHSLQTHPSLMPGEVPPPTRFTTVDGRKLSLPELKGKVVIFHAWNSGVANYRKDLPNLEKLHRKYAKDGLVVIVAGIGGPWGPQSMANYVKAKGFTFLNVVDGIDQTNLGDTWNIHSFPFQILVGRDGVVRAKNIEEAKLERAVQIALRS
jgi:beta-lactamase regulating signal transducer with metallopeptidase domain/outer membrane lipoprotein-sorting protein